MLVSDAVLVASELVTNAVRHGGAPTDAEAVEVRAHRGRVRLEVVDPGTGFDPGGHGPRHDGYGLHLLDRLAALGCRRLRAHDGLVRVPLNLDPG